MKITYNKETVLDADWIDTFVLVLASGFFLFNLFTGEFSRALCDLAIFMLTVRALVAETTLIKMGVKRE